jgi:hypothetical protein
MKEEAEAKMSVLHEEQQKYLQEKVYPSLKNILEMFQQSEVTLKNLEDSKCFSKTDLDYIRGI